MSVTNTASLESVLIEFHKRVEASAPVKKLIANWDRLVEVRAVTEAGNRSTFLRSSKGRVAPPTNVADGKADVTIVGSEEVLAGIFSGGINPSRAHLDGEVEAYGTPKDQLVLDAVVLLIWGA